MTSEPKGTVIIRALPDAEVEQKVIAFVCRNARNATPEAVGARLATLPAVLVRALPATTGTRLAAALQQLGADAAFVPDPAPAVAAAAVPPPAETPPPPVAAAAPPAPPSSGPTADTTTPAAAPPRPATPPRPPAAPPLRTDAPTLLLYACLASLVALVSPVFLLCSLPLGLYAVHRAGATLDVPVWLRGICLTAVFVPLANSLLLLVLSVWCFLALRRKSRAADAEDSGNVALVMRLAFTPLMVLALFGVSGGGLPSDYASLAESVESKLEKVAKRAGKKLPHTVNENLRIDSVTAGPQRLLTYNCTLLKYPAERYDADRLRAGMRDRLTKEVCASDDLEQLLKEEVAIAYSFSGNDGLPVTTVTVAGSDCGD